MLKADTLLEKHAFKLKAPWVAFCSSLELDQWALKWTSKNSIIVSLVLSK